jgi:hypothetical protein
VFSSVLSANPCDVLLEWPVDGEDSDANTVTFDLTVSLKTLEVRHNVLSETVSSGGEDNLTTGELETSSVEGFLRDFNVCGLDSDGDKYLVDGDAGGLNVGLAESTTHTLLKSIGSSAGKHLVDADGVPGVGTDAHVEGVLAAMGGHVFVGSNTSRFK